MIKTSKKNLSTWKSLKSHGDVLKIAEILGQTVQTVSKVINTGEGTETQIAVVNQFYKDRIRTIKKLNISLT